MTDIYDPPADAIGSYYDAIGAMRMSLTTQFEVAVKALLDIKRIADDGKYSRRTMLIFATATDALIALERNPKPVKRG